MARYLTNVASFDVPDSWKDQSITAFRLPPAPGGGDASFVVTRDESKGVGPFTEYIDRQIDQCRAGLPEFHLIRSDRMPAQDREMAWLEFTWAKDGTELYLRQIYYDCETFATICTLTTTRRDLAFFDPPWRKLMASLDFHPSEKAVFPLQGGAPAS